MLADCPFWVVSRPDSIASSRSPRSPRQGNVSVSAGGTGWLPTLAPRMRPTVETAWRREPLGYSERRLDASDLTAFFTVVVVGAPLLATGFVFPALEMSATQIVLAVPIGVLLGAGLLTMVAWASAFTGVSGLRFLTPAVGVSGSWLAAILRLLALGALGAQVLVVAEVNFQTALASVGGPAMPANSGLITVAVAALLLAAVGPVVVAKVWARRVAFWGVIGLLVAGAAVTLPNVNLADLFTRPAGPNFSLGIDRVLLLAVVWWSLAADTSRFGQDEAAAATGAGFGFGIPILVVVIVAGLFAISGGEVDAEGSLIGIGSGPIFGTAVFLWLLFAEVATVAGLAYAAANSLATYISRPAGVYFGGLLVVVMAGLGWFFDSGQLHTVSDLAIGIMAPMLAVSVTDFYVVRGRDYSVDDLFNVRGYYGAFNPWGWLSVLVGWIMSQVLLPTPGVIRLLSGISFQPLYETVSLPPMLTSMLMAAALYGVLGRIRIEKREYVSSLRGV